MPLKSPPIAPLLPRSYASHSPTGPTTLILSSRLESHPLLPLSNPTHARIIPLVPLFARERKWGGGPPPHLLLGSLQPTLLPRTCPLTHQSPSDCPASPSGVRVVMVGRWVSGQLWGPEQAHGLDPSVWGQCRLQGALKQVERKNPHPTSSPWRGAGRLNSSLHAWIELTLPLLGHVATQQFPAVEGEAEGSYSCPASPCTPLLPPLCLPFHHGELLGSCRAQQGQHGLNPGMPGTANLLPHSAAAQQLRAHPLPSLPILLSPIFSPPLLLPSPLHSSSYSPPLYSLAAWLSPAVRAIEFRIIASPCWEQYLLGCWRTANCLFLSQWNIQRLR